MTTSSGAGAGLAAGIILLAISSANIGYGLCMVVYEMENAIVPLGVGVMLAGLATILIARATAAGKPARDTDPAP